MTQFEQINNFNGSQDLHQSFYLLSFVGFQDGSQTRWLIFHTATTAGENQFQISMTNLHFMWGSLVLIIKIS